MEYFSKMYITRICTFKIYMNTVDHAIFIFILFFHLTDVHFFGFQTHTNHKICTKVRNTFPTFGINFYNHNPTSLKHQKTSKKQ
jgi:hypothetical protein